MSSDWVTLTADWQGDMAFIGKNKSGGSVHMGKVENKPGVSPMELLLAGLAGCTGVDIVHILRKKRISLHDFRVSVRAKRADDHPKVYTEIEINYVFWGQDLLNKDVEQAIQLSEEKYCSASAMLGATAKISSSYRILTPSLTEED
ncbi:MAG: OsmC family protein [Chloroflexi bacterium]|nr:OsmC family protein [Chloroflexota bacterium]